MTDNIALGDFSEDARALLAGLDVNSIRSLSIQAKHEKNRFEAANWSTEPEAVAREVREILGRTVTLDTDDGLEDVKHSLDLAVTVLSLGDDIDGCDARALGWLLDRASDIMRQELVWHREARERLRHLLFPDHR